MKQILSIVLVFFALLAQAQGVEYGTFKLNGVSSRGKAVRDRAVYPPTPTGNAAFKAAVETGVLSVTVLNSSGWLVRVIPARVSQPTTGVPNWITGMRYSHTGSRLTMEAAGNVGQLKFERQDGQPFVTTNPDNVTIVSGRFYSPGVLQGQGYYDKQWAVNLPITPMRVTAQQAGGTASYAYPFTPTLGADRIVLSGASSSPPVCTTCSGPTTPICTTCVPGTIAFTFQPITTNVNYWPEVDETRWERLNNQPIGRKIYLQNEFIKIGFWEKAGGAACELYDLKGPTPGDNIINNADLGRQLQLALYRGGRTSPNPFAEINTEWATREGKTAPGGGTGNNPIQAGDVYKNSSPVLQMAWNANTVYIKSRLMNWPVRNELTDVILETWSVIGTDRAVRIYWKITNNRQDDQLQSDAWGQEYPCFYANDRYRFAAYYAGDQPYSNAPVTRRDDAGDQRAFAITENWIANIDENNRGAGIVAERLFEVTHKRQCPGCGGSNTFAEASPYVAFQPQLHVGWNETMYSEWHIVVGHVNEIRQYATSRPWSRSFAYNFKNSADRGWWFRNWSSDNEVPLPADGWTWFPVRKQGAVVSPRLSFPAGQASRIFIRMAYTGPLNRFRLRFWRSDMNIGGLPIFVEFPVTGDGVARTIEIPLAGNPDWRGIINRLSIQRYINFGTENQDDPVSGESVRMEWINTVNAQP